jgi:hypothetical protein
MILRLCAQYYYIKFKVSGQKVDAIPEPVELIKIEFNIIIIIIFKCTYIQSHEVMGFFPRLKRPDCKVHLSSPSRAEVKNEYKNISISPVRFGGVERDNSVFGTKMTYSV